MTRTSYFLASLAISVIGVLGLLLGALLITKILFPDARGSAVLWTLAWPALLLRYVFPSVGPALLIAVSVCVAIVIYIAICTLVTFVVWLRVVAAINNRRPWQPVPAPPHFD